MIKTKANYHVSLKKSPAVKIAAVLVFAMFLNILNIGAFASMSDSVRLSSSVLKLENELGRIYSAVNLPIKIVNDMFKKNRELSENSKDKNSNANRLFALLIPVKQTKKSASILRLDANISFSKGKVLFKPESSVLTAGPPKYRSMFNYSAGTDAAKLMLLLLLMLLLPRGIPVKTQNFIINKYKLCISRLYLNLNEDGNFRFITECKGRY
ncbi:MAG: hypothetical protein FWG57_04060 [Endomicrobia bacterium]|nr:hypothetical protein [Endomicrobiia bacterium]